MDHNNFETTNAHAWDKDSSISAVPPSNPAEIFGVIPDLINLSTEDSSNKEAQHLQTRSWAEFVLPRVDPAGSQQLQNLRSNNGGQRGGTENSRSPAQTRGSGTRGRGQRGAPSHRGDISQRGSNYRGNPSSLRSLGARGARNNSDLVGQRHGQDARGGASNGGDLNNRGGISNSRGRGNSDPKLPRQQATRGAWAEPAPLKTTQVAEHENIKKREKEIQEQYLDAPPLDTDLPSSAYYIWDSDTTGPMDLFGMKLEKLNPVRLDYKVWIEWLPLARCLQISSRSYKNGYRRVTDAVKCIRNIAQDTKASSIFATPIYIATPPTTDGIKAIVRPRTIRSSPKLATDLELFEDYYSEEQRKAWSKTRSTMLMRNQKKLEQQLIKGLLSLAPYRGWMRLRVHFGRVGFTEYRKDFAESKLSFEKFSSMLGLARTTAQLERQLEDVALATKLMKTILNWPQRFMPVEGVTQNLTDARFKHTGVMFVALPTGETVRVEVDIDTIYVDTSGTREYQYGGYRVFKDDNRNKRLDITTIDVEKEVDWCFEVITDNTVQNPAKQLETLAKGSVSTRTPTAKDPLGLPYPRFMPKDVPGIRVSRSVVRSVIEYMIDDCEYVVEIAVYRTWDDARLAKEPTMAAGVSMYHHAWDMATESIVNTTKERGWDKSLHHLFDNGRSAEGKGLRALLNEIEVIQGCLSSAKKC